MNGEDEPVQQKIKCMEKHCMDEIIEVGSNKNMRY